MHVLFLSPRQCWPPRSGAKLREYHFARALGRHAHLTHVFFAEPDTPAPSPADMPFCRELIAVPAPRRYTAGRIAGGLLGPWPLPVLHYISPQMKTLLARLISERQYDLVHLDGVHMAGYLPMLRQAGMRVVCNWHNIESEVIRRYGEHVTSIPRRWYAAATWPRLAAVERQILAAAFGHVACSQRDRAQLIRVAPDARAAVIENGVDSGFFAEAAGSAQPRRRLVFIGDMKYYANVDAAISFGRSAWPRIHERYPDWWFTLVGANPTAAVQALAGEKGIEVTGTVPDVRPYYGEAFAAVVPLRIGGGTRLKILEAMAAGVPVVSTPLGAEGLEITPGEHFLAADDGLQWLARLAELAQNQGLWTRLSVNGRALARRRYDWGVLGESLCATYSQWLDAPRDAQEYTAFTSR